MKNKRGFAGLAAALTLLSALAAQGTVYAQSSGFPGADEDTRIWKVAPLGVSPLLVGQWKNGVSATSPKSRTEITLQNPTQNSQAALIIYYDDEETFLQCEVKYLSPHDIESFEIPVSDFTGASMMSKGGAFEVVTTAAANLEGKWFKPDGTAESGSTRTFLTEPIHDGLVGSYTIHRKVGKIEEDRTLPLHQVNFRYFSVPENTNLFEACVCEKDPSDFNFLPVVNCYPD